MNLFNLTTALLIRVQTPRWFSGDCGGNPLSVPSQGETA